MREETIAFFCVTVSIYDMKFGMIFWPNVTKNVRKTQNKFAKRENLSYFPPK